MPLDYLSTPRGPKAKKRSSWICIVQLLRSWGLSHLGLGAWGGGGHPALAQQRALPTCCQLEGRNENMCLAKVVLC